MKENQKYRNFQKLDFLRPIFFIVKLEKKLRNKEFYFEMFCETINQTNVV